MSQRALDARQGRRSSGEAEGVGEGRGKGCRPDAGAAFLFGRGPSCSRKRRRAAATAASFPLSNGTERLVAKCHDFMRVAQTVW